MARIAFRSFNPARVIKSKPLCSAVSSDTGMNVGLIMAPLSPIAAANKFLDNGVAIWAKTEIDPADSPAMVTLDGSPPKAKMFLLTQRNAAV